MKRVLILSVVYAVFAFFVCLAAAFIRDIPELLSSDALPYRLLSAARYFLKLLPSLCISAALVAGTMEFRGYGRKCRERFSPAIMHLFGSIIKISLVLLLLTTISREIFLPIVTASRSQLRSDYRLYCDYLKWGEFFLNEGNPELALHYAQGIAAIDSESAESQDFISRAESAFEASEHLKGFSLGEDGKKDEDESKKAEPLSKDDLRQKARDAASRGDWFSSHYYANLAEEIGGEDEGGSVAWENLSIPQKSINASQYEEIYDVYDTKYFGYSALLNGDPKTAYYTFKKLYDTSRSLADDPDIRQYLAKSETELLKKYFFVDEMDGIEHFESARDIYFCTKDESGTFVVFVRGVTDFAGGKYLRGLNVHKFGADGKEEYEMTVPFAKMIASDEGAIHIMVKSVYKESDLGVTEPIFTFSDGRTEKKDDLFFDLPMPYSDFVLVSGAAVGAEDMFLPNLMQFVRKGAQYGFSTESLRLILTERLCYPLLLLIIFVFCASFSWNYRLEEGRIFRFSWILTFPFLTFSCYIAISCALYALKLLAAVIVGMAGVYALPASLAACVFLLTAVSLLFLARKSD